MQAQRRITTRRQTVSLGIIFLLLAVSNVTAASKQQKEQDQQRKQQQQAPSNLPRISHSIYNEDLPIVTKHQIMQITSGSRCPSSSPIYGIKYNQTFPQEEKEADFCKEYSQRTCCSLENFSQLKQQQHPIHIFPLKISQVCCIFMFVVFRKQNRFHKQMYMQVDLSLDCQQVLQQLICYDCDGDVGVGYRRGVCSTQCGQLYQVCQNDYFVVEQKSTQRIRVCTKNDVVCSKLKDILDFSHRTDFCTLLGYEVNDQVDYDEWFFQFVSDTVPDLKTFQPVCWNFQPSALFLGPALPAQPPPPPPPKPRERKTPTKGPKFDPNNPLAPFAELNRKYEIIVYVLYAILGVVILGLLIYCCCSYCARKDKDDFHYD